VRNESWPFRKSDALFVVAVVLAALPAQGNEWGIDIPPALTFSLVVAAVAVWIRFRVFGRRDHFKGK
jgi:hypothetical protein